MSDLYRIYSQDGVICGSLFLKALFAHNPKGLAKTPDNEVCPKGEWYCTGGLCPVREVQVKAKYLDEPAPTSPPPMSCPVCGEPMKFHGYVRRAIMLVPEAKCN